MYVIRILKVSESIGVFRSSLDIDIFDLMLLHMVNKMPLETIL